MAFQVGVGREDFDLLRKSGGYYVDKTELIYDLVHYAGNAVTLFTRPRRFGKTLNMSMLESFFDINRDSRSVFEGLDIVRHFWQVCLWDWDIRWIPTKKAAWAGSMYW